MSLTEAVPCRHIHTGGEGGYTYRYEQMRLSLREMVLVCVNLRGLLLDDTDGYRRRYEARYTGEEVEYRDGVARDQIAPLVSTARSSGIGLVYVSDSSPNIGLESSVLFEMYTKHLNIDPTRDFRESGNDTHEYLLEQGTSGYSQSLAPRSGDYVVRKWTYSAFFGTWFDRLLRNIGTTTVMLCGFDTESDILCTGLDSTAYGYTTILVRDAISTACRADYSDAMTLNDRWVLHFEEAIGFSVEAADIRLWLEHESNGLRR